MEAIGNKLGMFISIEDDWEMKVDHRCAIILVEIDMREGIMVACGSKGRTTEKFRLGVTIVNLLVICKRTTLSTRRSPSLKICW